MYAPAHATRAQRRRVASSVARRRTGFDAVAPPAPPRRARAAAEHVERARRTLLGRVVLGGLQLEQLGELGEWRAGVGVAGSLHRQHLQPEEAGAEAEEGRRLGEERQRGTEPTKASASQPSRSLPDDGRHAAAATAPRERRAGSGAGERERHDAAARGGVARGGEGGGAE